MYILTKIINAWYHLVNCLYYVIFGHAFCYCVRYISYATDIDVVALEMPQT